MKREAAWRRGRMCLLISGTLISLWLFISLAVAYTLTRRSCPVFAEPAPALAWGTFEPRRLKTRDGHHIGAWLLPGKKEALSVLLLHGNGGSRNQCADIAKILSARGCTVFMISLRAHGDSTGEYNDMGYGARLDVIAAVEFLEGLHPGGGIVIHGRSLGAAAAVFASGELGRRVRGYILECPYQDLKTAVRNRTENALPWPLDGLAYQGLLMVSPLVLPHWSAIAPIESIEGIPEEVSVLIMAGGSDRSARLHEARALHARVRSHGTLSIFENADHLQLHILEPARYEREILHHLDRLEGAFSELPSSSPSVLPAGGSPEGTGISRSNERGCPKFGAPSALQSNR